MEREAGGPAPERGRVRRACDRLARRLARTLLRIFFRRIDLEGLDRVPREGAVLFVANHVNALIDPFLLVGFLPRRARFLAKSTLWRNPVVLPFLLLGGVVPVHRRQDGGDMARNDRTFARCHDELRAGGAVALFPEGISHSEPELQAVRTGAARIVLGADGPVDVVPVGLTFDAKSSFRSSTLVRVGEPIAAEGIEALRAAAPDEHAAVRNLTERIEAGLRQVTLNHQSWESARHVALAVDLVLYEDGAAPGLADRFDARRRFADGPERLRELEPDTYERLAADMARYEAGLARLGVRDDQLAAAQPLRRVLGYSVEKLPVLIATLPLAGLGALLNYVPYKASGLVGRLVGRHPDQPATFKLMAGFAALPFCWTLESAAVAGAWGLWPAGVATALFAPLSGWIALRFQERNAGFWAEAWAGAVLSVRRGTAAELRRLRGAIRDELVAAAERLEKPAG